MNDQGRQNTYNSKFEGVITTLTRRYFDTTSNTKGGYDDYITTIECPECNGHRLNLESLSVFVKGKNIGELTQLCVTEAREFFKSMKLSKGEQHIVKKVMKNIEERLEFLEGVGLGYMALSRKSNTLSG